MRKVIVSVCPHLWMGGYSIPGLDGGLPIPGPDGGYPIPDLNQG